jgi:hypothetical protein
MNDKPKKPGDEEEDDIDVVDDGDDFDAESDDAEPDERRRDPLRRPV